MNKNIALVGFMGSGKTTVAILLAKKLGRRLISTDDLIIQKEKQAIMDIFATKGEPYFRRLEKEVIAKISQEKNLVIDCGGGIVLQEENMANLKENGVIVYLKASVDVLHERTKSATHRPLLCVSDPKSKIKDLLFTREPFYQKADHIIDTSTKTASDVVEDIVRLLDHDEH